MPGVFRTHLSQGLGLCGHMLFRTHRAGYTPLRWVSDSHWPSGVNSFSSPPSGWRVGWGHLMAPQRTPHRSTHGTPATHSASHLTILCPFNPFPLVPFVPRCLHFHFLVICAYVIWCLCIKSKNSIVEKTHNVCRRLTYSIYDCRWLNPLSCRWENFHCAYAPHFKMPGVRYF